jgi:hypothetical protein
MELLKLSPVDPWRLEQAVSGVIILGATRSGKTSGPFAHIVRSFLRSNFGGIFFCVKPEAAEEYKELAEKEGRLDDVIFFGPNHSHQFNFLTYEASRYGKGKAIVENIVQLILQSAQVLSRKYGQGKGDDYFENAMKQILRNCLEVLLAAEGEITLTRVLKLVQTLPSNRNDVLEPEKFEALRLLVYAEENAPPERAHGLALARGYFTDEWPALGDRTRSSVSTTLTGVLDCLLRYPLHDLFGQGVTVSPDDILNGKLIIVDIPINENYDFGEIAAVLWKSAVQRAILARPELRWDKDKKPFMRPIFLAGDECQYFVSSGDILFATTCAGARGISVYATQSLELLFQKMGSDGNAQSGVLALLGNLRNRFVCNVDDPRTQTWVADTIGKVLLHRTTESESSSWQPGSGGGNIFAAAMGNRSFSESTTEAEQVDYELQPSTLARLKQGGHKHGKKVEAIITSAGTAFNASGKIWLKATFDQGCNPGMFSSDVRITAKRL